MRVLLSGPQGLDKQASANIESRSTSRVQGGHNLPLSCFPRPTASGPSHAPGLGAMVFASGRILPGWRTQPRFNALKFNEAKVGR